MQGLDTFRGFFYINFTLRQWTGRVERAHIFFHDDWGQPGQGIGLRGQLSSATPLAPPMGASGSYHYFVVKGQKLKVAGPANAQT